MTTNRADLRLALARAARDAVTASMHLRTDATTARPRSRIAAAVGGITGRSVPIVASTPTAMPDGQTAVTSWDLERFSKNPVVLWAHDQAGVNLPIGVASEIEHGADGLKMVVTLASERANPLAEQIANCIAEGIIRAVSVGFADLGNGRAELLEVSFVPVGLDEDAGTPDLNPAAEDGAQRKRYFGGPDDEAHEAKAEEDRAREEARDRAREKHRTDATDDDAAVTRAREERDLRARDAWRTPPTTTTEATMRTDAEDEPDPLDVGAARQRMLDRFAAMGR